MEATSVSIALHQIDQKLHLDVYLELTAEEAEKPCARYDGCLRLE